MHCSSLFDNAQLTCLAAKHGASQQPSRLPSPHFLPPETGSLSTLVKWVASILLVSLATISLSFAEDAGNLYNTPFDINAGARYFEKQCSRCHGFDARGNDEVGAPNLTGTLKRASSSAGIYTILREGITDTAMMAVDPKVPDSQPLSSCFQATLSSNRLMGKGNGSSHEQKRTVQTATGTSCNPHGPPAGESIFEHTSQCQLAGPNSSQTEFFHIGDDDDLSLIPI